MWGKPDHEEENHWVTGRRCKFYTDRIRSADIPRLSALQISKYKTEKMEIHSTKLSTEQAGGAQNVKQNL